MHGGVLQSDEGGIGVQQSPKELGASVHVQEAIGVAVEPKDSGIAQESTGGLSNYEIEACI